MNNSEYAIPSKSRNVSNDESLTDQDHDDDQIMLALRVALSTS